MVTLCIAILAIFAGTLFNNLRTRDLNRHIDDKFALFSQQMKTMEDNILRLIGYHETRLQKLEGRRDERAG